MIRTVHSIVYHGISGPGGVTVELLARAPYSARDDALQATFGIALERQRGVHAIGGDRREDFDTWMGTMSFTPPGMDVFSESPTGGEYLAIRWDQGGGQGGGHRALSRPQRTAPAALLQQALVLRRLLVGQAPATQVEARVQQLLAGLDALLQGPDPTRAPGAALRPAYALVMERIDDEIGHPAEDLSLAALSAQVGEAPLAFLRHFKQLTGMTPHAYVNERRLQRARRELQAPQAVLADVAAQAGYASQSHMGTAMRRALQLTPAGYRARALAGLAPA